MSRREGRRLRPSALGLRGHTWGGGALTPSGLALGVCCPVLGPRASGLAFPLGTVWGRCSVLEFRNRVCNHILLTGVR